MKEVATIILNRNLPKVTDALYENIQKHNAGHTDIFVVESGSSKNNLSKYCSYWANWEESLEHGLRYGRGFNYGLYMMLKDGKFNNYKYFFLVSNDAVFEEEPFLHKLTGEFEQHPRVGI